MRTGNTVVLSNGAAGEVTAATATTLTVTLSTQPTSTGNLTAVVTSFGLSSGAPVVVAAVVAAPAASVAYIPNVLGNTVTECAIAADGSITSCVVPPTPSGGWNLALPVAIAVANNIAYVTNDNNVVTQCTITAGSITACAVPTISGAWQINTARSMAVYNNVIYIPNYVTNSVTQCITDGDGSITSCNVPNIAWNLGTPTGIAIVNNTAYILNVISTGPDVQGITECTIDGSGNITSCVIPPTPSTGWLVSSAQQIVIVDNIGFIVNGDNVVQCSMTNGSFTSCAVPPVPNWAFSGGYGIAIQNNYAYVISFGPSSVTRCTIESGTIVSCALTFPPGGFNLNYPSDIAIAS